MRRQVSHRQGPQGLASRSTNMAGEKIVSKEKKSNKEPKKKAAMTPKEKKAAKKAKKESKGILGS